MTDQTKKNLRKALAGESKANRRYLAFSEKASEEGFSNIARLFRVIAESETIHAFNHMKAMGAVHSTLENVEEAWRGEKDEYSSMYPMFIDQAERDANTFAANFLIPPARAGRLHRLRSRRSVVDFAHAIGVAPGIVVGRLQREEIIPHRNLNALKRKLDWVSA